MEDAIGRRLAPLVNLPGVRVEARRGWHPEEVVGRHRGVLDHVVEDGDDLRLRALDGRHDPQRVEDVGKPLLVHLARVRPGRDLQRFLDRRHHSPCGSRRGAPARERAAVTGPGAFGGWGGWPTRAVA